MHASGTVITTADILPTATTIAAATTTTPNSNFNRDNDDDGYDLVIPKLVLFILIPIFIVMVLIIVIPIVCICLWRRHKLRNMKYRVKIAEIARNHKDTLEQNKLTQGTYQNAYAESSFTTASQSSPPVPQWQPPVLPSQSPAAQQWPSVSPSQSSVPQWRPPVPRSQSPVPRSPAPPPPISRHHKPPAPPPPPLSPDELTPLQSTTDVTIEAQVPFFNTGITNRTSTISGGFNVLAAVERRSTVSTGGGISTSASESQLQRSASNRSAFHSLGRKEQLITPPSSPPPPPPLPPINRISPPPVSPKPKKNVNQEILNEEPEDTYEDIITNSEPLYEPIPGEKEELGYVDMVPPPFIDSNENVYDDDAGIHAMQEATSNVPYDTYDVPTSQPGSYNVHTLQSASSDTCDPPASQPNSYDTYDVPPSQPASSDTSNVPMSQINSNDTYDVPPSQPASINTNSCDVPMSSNFCPPPRPPKLPMISQNPLDCLVEDKDPINKHDTNQEICKLNGMDYMCEVLDLNEND